MNNPIKFEILHCTDHDFYAIGINGVRVLGSKCCGRWKIVETWQLSKADLTRIKELLLRGPRMRPGLPRLPPRK